MSAYVEKLPSPDYELVSITNSLAGNQIMNVREQGGDKMVGGELLPPSINSWSVRQGKERACRATDIEKEKASQGILDGGSKKKMNFV